MKYILSAKYHVEKSGIVNKEERRGYTVHAVDAVLAIKIFIDMIANNADGAIINVQVSCAIDHDRGNEEEADNRLIW